MLHVPKINKNLISVSKLTTDNGVYVEFHADYCVVKDKRTMEILLRGNIRDGLYQLDTSMLNSTSHLQSISRKNEHKFTSKVAADSSLQKESVTHLPSASSLISKNDV